MNQTIPNSQTINLSLELAEISNLVQALGSLPTSSNVWPLRHKIQEQAQEQIAARQAQPPQRVTVHENPTQNVKPAQPDAEVKQ